MSSRLFLAGTGIVLSAGVIVLLVGRMPSRHALAPPPPVSAAVVPAPVVGARLAEDFIGVVVADESSDVSARLDGYLQSVEVHVGDRVNKGDVLARQDVQRLRQELAINEAELRGAQADQTVAQLTLTAAQETLQRGGDPKLVSLGAISTEEHAKLLYAEKLAGARLSAAQAQVQNHQARVEQLQVMISEATLRAPFDGMVSQRYLDPGSQVAVGTPIVRVLKLGVQMVRFAIPEESSSLVRAGMGVRIAVPGGEVPLQGRVEYMAPEVDAASRMVLGIARPVAERAPRLPFGTVVRVSVEEGAPVGPRPEP